MKPLILLIRHLPTTEDELGLFSDPDAEVPLLDIDTSRLEAVLGTIEALRANRDVPLAIFGSTTERSTKSVELLASRLRRVSTTNADNRLSNIRHPEWNGLNQKVVRDSALYRQWHSEPSEVVFPGGESLREVEQRVIAFLGDMPSACDSLIVSHSTPLQVLACRLLGTPLDGIWSFYFEAYAVTAIVGGILVRFNDVSARPCNYEALYE